MFQKFIHYDLSKGVVLFRQFWVFVQDLFSIICSLNLLPVVENLLDNQFFLSTRNLKLNPN